MRVLLVEDDVGDAVLTRELLFDAGLDMSLGRTMTLGEAEEGAAEAADCVLLDLGLPDVGDLDAVARVREQRRARRSSSSRASTTPPGGRARSRPARRTTS